MPSASEYKKAFEAGTAGIGEKYKKGIAGVSDWHAKATSPQAKANYETAITAAIATDARGRGLADTSNAEWQQRAQTKGASSIASAMVQSSDKAARGYDSKVRAVLENVTLPDRTTDGEQNTINRVIPIVRALMKK